MPTFTLGRLTSWHAVVAAAGGLVSIAGVVMIAALVCERYSFQRSLRTGHSIAAYLAIVTPRSRRAAGSGYQPAPLIAQARALSTLSGFSDGVEVYHGTAPLVRATAPVLPPTTYDSVRRWDSGIAWEGRALVPLRRPDSAVVGAVGVARRPDQPWPMSPVLLVFAAVAVFAGWRAWKGSERDALAVYAVASLALGVTAGMQVRRVAVASADRWLLDVRLLIQEAVARSPRGRVSLQVLGRIAPGTVLGPARPGSSPRRERDPAGGSTMVIPVRLSVARWLELRVSADAPPTGRWWVLLLTASAAGPGIVALVRWRSPRGKPG